MSSFKVKLSRIQFPEICPVCMEEAEDLVFVTILNRAGDDFDVSSWKRRQDRIEVALEASRGSTTFAVPTCMRHGSKSVRSLRTKLIAVLGFFIMFYPILFYLLQINVALNYSRPLNPPLIGFLVTSFTLFLFFIYGFFPRALERALRFHNVSRVHDSLDISISNPEYLTQFLKMNKMNSEVSNDETN
ncbi:MAG: hypothetical protein ACFFE6_02340 [Candidatus Thorarchaeota archaeon]